MKIRDLTTEQLKALIQETVEEKLQEMLGDPDQGLELREEVKQRLRESLDAAERGIMREPFGEEIGRVVEYPLTLACVTLTLDAEQRNP